MLELDGERIRFSHPLLAAGAYARLDGLARRRLHRRLAGLVEHDEERWRHLALATRGPDATVAAGLERAAVRARRRGASTSAADLCELAQRLTPPEQREDLHRRTLAAGFHRWGAGDTKGACARFAQAAETAPRGALRAQAMAAQARALAFEGDQRGAARLARRALAEPERRRRGPRRGRAGGLLGVDVPARALEDGAASTPGSRSGSPSGLGDRALAANALGVQGLIEAALGRPEARATFARAARPRRRPRPGATAPVAAVRPRCVPDVGRRARRVGGDPARLP